MGRAPAAVIHGALEVAAGGGQGVGIGGWPLSAHPKSATSPVPPHFSIKSSHEQFIQGILVC
jgi:hypothetical protein